MEKQESGLTAEDIATHNSMYDHLRNRLTLEECETFYQQYSIKYDEHKAHMAYKGPDIIADTVLEKFGDRKDLRIMDAAAGTGLVGEKLYERGFTNLDALDLSPEMLKQAEAKNIYRNLFCETLSSKQSSLTDDMYDCLVMSGGMAKGHVPISALFDMIRVVKPGGLIVNLSSDWYVTDCPEFKNLDALSTELEEKGKWRKISRTVEDRYCETGLGVMYVFEVLESGFGTYNSTLV